jgi:hypothetical protein
MNLGQIALEVQRCATIPIHGVTHAGGEMMAPAPILEAIRRAVDGHRTD